MALARTLVSLTGTVGGLAWGRGGKGVRGLQAANELRLYLIFVIAQILSLFLLVLPPFVANSAKEITMHTYDTCIFATGQEYRLIIMP